MVNSINNKTTSEALAKQKLDALNEIRKTETKNKCLINGQKLLLSLFDDLVEVIFSNNNKNNNNNNNNVSVNKHENDNESVNENDNESVNHDDDDDHDEDYYIIKQLKNYFKTIDETKSFKEQVETLKVKDFLK